MWHEAIDDLDSNIDVTPFRQSLPKLASDLKNYMTKDIDSENAEGDRRYA